jgi:DNA-binding NarL/FixJ family response regulator
MSEIKTQLIFDASTNTEVILELSTEELKDRKAIKDAADLLQAEQAAKIASRESALAKLAALGLTEDEIAAL